jgi:hypothetical protein
VIKLWRGLVVAGLACLPFAGQPILAADGVTDESRACALLSVYVHNDDSLRLSPNDVEQLIGQCNKSTDLAVCMVARYAVDDFLKRHKYDPERFLVLEAPVQLKCMDRI